MRKYLIILLLLGTIAKLNAQTIKYVSVNGAGTKNGSSWQNAAPVDSLQKIINTIATPAEVWIAKGTYILTSPLAMRNDVTIYGGFKGTEALVSERSLQKDSSILSGNGSIAVGISNATTLSKTAIMDGVAITGCTDAGIVSLGGLFRNCTIKNNQGTQGGVKNTSADFVNCIVTNNNNRGFYMFSGTCVNSIISFNNVGIADCTGKFINCDIVKNRDHSVYSNDVIITNCVLWDMGTNVAIKGIATVSYSAIKDSAFGTNIKIDKVNNNSNGPNFVNLAKADYRLASTSPLINGGVDSVNTESKDFEGISRKTGKIDIGAFEYSVRPTLKLTLLGVDAEPIIDARLAYYGASIPSNKSGVILTELIADNEECLLTSDSYTDTLKFVIKIKGAGQQDTTLKFSRKAKTAYFLLSDCMDTLVATGGIWYSFDDAGSGGLSTITPMRTTTQKFKMSSPGYKGASDSCFKAVMSLSKGTSLYDPFVGFGFKLTVDSKEVGIDWSNAKYMEFYHKGAACILTPYMSNFMNGTAIEDNQWRHEIPAHTDWTLVRVTFDNSSTGFSLPVWFTPAQQAAAPAIDPTKFFKIQWQVQSAMTGYKDSMYIDEIVISGVKPKAKIEASSKKLCPNSTVTLQAKAIGNTNPVSYKWNDAQTTASKAVTTAGTYSVTVYQSGEVISNLSIQVEKPFADQIKVVTNDFTKNAVVLAWKPTKGKGIKSYNLERLNGFMYDSINGAKFSDSSVIIDKSASAIGKTFFYRLASVDSTCNTKTYSDTSNTILLTGDVLSTGECVLSWNAYNEKQNSFYYIYSRDNSQQIVLLDSVQATVDASKYSYVIRKAYSEIKDKGLLFYVAYKLPEIIDLTKIAPSIPPFTVATSNFVEMPITNFGYTAKQKINDTTISLGDLSAKYEYSKYFNNLKAGVPLKIYSSTDVLNFCEMSDYFGFIAAKTGKSVVTVCAGDVSQTFTVTVNSPSCNVTVQPTVTNSNCFGTSSGAITLSVSGGVAPYTFLWSNMRTDNKLSNLNAGKYSVIITDATACKVTKSFVIAEPKKIVVSIDSVRPTLNQTDGSFSLNVSGGVQPYKYQWNKPEWNIKDSVSKVSSITASTYKVTITDQNGCKKEQIIALGSKTDIDIQIDELKGTNCNPNDGRIKLLVSGGRGKKEFLWSDGATTQNRNNLAAGDYEVTVTDEDGSKAIRSIQVLSFEFSSPEIALVTVKKNKNLVVWQKDSTTAIKYYTVYREANNSGEFDPIGTVKYDSVSVFEDNVANTANQSWRYRLSATNYCGIESVVSAAQAEYKTINLQVTPQTNAIDLKWDAYEGLYFLEYVIYRKTNNDEFVELARIPANKTSFTDNTLLNDVKYAYRVEVVMPQSINPLLFKTDTGPFSQSYSNMSEASLVSESELVIEGVSIYPNPAKDEINITAANAEGAQVSLFAASGAVITKTIIANGKAQFTVAGLAKGIYTIQLQTNDKAVSEQVVVE